MVKAVPNTDKKKLCALIILLTASSKKKEVKNRKLWSRQWLLIRKKLGCYENLMRELALQDKEGYRQWIRMDTATFEYLLEKVTPLIIKQNTVMREAIPAGERYALTLRYLATGETQRSLAFTFRIAQNTISGIIPVVCRAIFEVLKDEYLQTPDEIHKWKKIASRFQSLWNFPNCIGALDGKHVKIVPPPQSGSSYYNYKGDFSIVLLALVDADLRFIYVYVGTNGRISDGGVWSKSTLKKAFDLDLLNIPSPDYLPGTNEKVPFVIVADDAFPLGNNLMKPFPGAGRKTLPHQQRIYNYRVSRARRVVENEFGILAARFQIFKGKIPLHVSTTKLITLAVCVLHNLLRSKVYSRYIPAGTLDRVDMRTGEIKTGDWRDYRSSLSNFKKSPFKSADVAKEIQRRFCNYFNSVGAVPWQNKMCDLH